MADRALKLRELRQLLKPFDVWEDSSRGKGSHTMFFRRIGGREFSYPIPTNQSDVRKVYVKGIRAKFLLRAEDGISDQQFYGC